MDAGTRVIDLHLHGIGEFDTQTDSSDDVLSIAEIEGMEGVDCILLSLYPAPIPIMRQHLTAVQKAKERQRLIISNEPSWGPSPNTQHPTPNSPFSARILGVHLEGPFLNPRRCGALDAQSFLLPSWDDYRRLTEGFEDLVKTITVAPELEGAPELIAQLVRSQVIVSMGHSDASFAEAEAGFHAGATGVTHLFNAMRPFTHRDPGISAFALNNPDIYVELIADPHHLHPETLRLVFSIKARDRILIVSDTVKGSQAGQPSDRPPINEDTGGLRGGSMSIIASTTRLIKAGFDKRTVMAAITENPARYLGIA